MCFSPRSLSCPAAEKKRSHGPQGLGRHQASHKSLAAVKFSKQMHTLGTFFYDLTSHFSNFWREHHSWRELFEIFRGVTVDFEKIFISGRGNDEKGGENRLFGRKIGVIFEFSRILLKERVTVTLLG